MKRWWLLGPMALLVGGAVWGLHIPPQTLGTITVPDTRNIVGVGFDSAVAVSMLRVLSRAIPREGAVCLIGGVVPTPDGRTAVLLRQAVPATILASSIDRVQYVCPSDGSVVGVAHTHLFVTCADGYNNPSHEDAVALASSPWLFTMAVCLDGTLALLYQDGRRYRIPYVRKIPTDSS